MPPTDLPPSLFGGLAFAPRPARAQAKPARMAEIAPNRWIQLDLSFTPPELILCDCEPQPDGTWKLVPRNWEHHERVTAALCRKLGLGNRTDTLRRLIRGGFVAGAHIAPETYTVDLTSYFRHYERCAEDPDYWSNPKVIAEYRATL